MAWTYDISDGLLQIQAADPCHDADLRATIAAITSDPRFTPDLKVLLDFTAVEDFRLSAEYLSMVGSLQLLSAQARSAFVMPTGFAHALVEFFKMVAGPEPIRSFDSREEALRWLAGS